MSGLKSSKFITLANRKYPLVKFNTTSVAAIPADVTDVDTIDYYNSVISNGGTIQQSDLRAVQTFVRSLKSYNLWTKLLDVGIYCGDQLAAALVKLKGMPGTGRNLLNFNFLEADYGRFTGLKGDGTTKYLKTGIIPSTMLTLGDTSLGVFNRSYVAGTGVMGIDAAFELFYPFSDSRAYSDMYDTANGRTSVALPAAKAEDPFGFVASSRISTTSHAIYRNGGLLTLSTAGPSIGSLTANEFYLFARNTSNSPTQFSTFFESFYMVAKGLTTEEMINLNTALQAFQRTLGRIASDGFPALPMKARWTPDSMATNGSTFTWSDVSGNGYHATKSSGTLPSIVTGLNGKNAAQGANGSDRRLVVASPSTLFTGPQFAIYAVFKTPTTPQNLQAVFGSSTYGGTDGSGFSTNMMDLEFTSASYPSKMQTRFATNNRRFPNGTLYAGEITPDTQNVTADLWTFHYFEYDGNNARGYLNGTWTADFTQNGVMIPPSIFYLMGTNYNPDFFFGGQLHEVGILYTMPTADQRFKLFNYINATYGL